MLWYLDKYLGDFMRRIILLDYTKPIIRMASLRITPKLRLRLTIKLSPKFRLADRKLNGGKSKPKMVKLYFKKLYQYLQLMTTVTELAHIIH